jgi:pyruvate dehydrogenase E1 component alpha subunit
MEAGFATEAELKAIDKEARAEVDKAMEEAKASPEPPMSDYWAEVYVPGTEPKYLRGLEPEDLVSCKNQILLLFSFAS